MRTDLRDQTEDRRDRPSRILETRCRGVRGLGDAPPQSIRVKRALGAARQVARGAQLT